MSDLRKAAELALDVLESAQNGMNECYEETGFDFANEQYEVEQVIQALRQALAQPEQEPVAFVSGYYHGHCVVLPVDQSGMFVSGTAFYTAPPHHASDVKKREWVGLTDEAIWLEYQTLWPFHPHEEPRLAKDIAKFAHAIEAKLKEKNT